MWPYISRAGTACALAMVLLAPSAAAQSGDGFNGVYAGQSWSLKKVKNGAGQCTMIVNHGAMGLDAAGTTTVKEAYGTGRVVLIEWTGSCDADGLIDGRGTLYIDLDETGDYFSKRFVGSADRGVFTGPVGYNAYYDVDADEYGELDADQPVTFVNGCNNWAGTQVTGCDTGQADQLRGQYLAGRASAAAARPTPPANPKPVAAVPAKPAGPVAIDIPPSETGTLNGQQNAAAADWLKKDSEAKRIQAEKVADFERKQAEFNRQQAEYQRQQDAYRAATAAHQAEVARIARANADIDACNKGDRSRCPAPN